MGHGGPRGPGSVGVIVVAKVDGVRQAGGRKGDSRCLGGKRGGAPVEEIVPLSAGVGDPDVLVGLQAEGDVAGIFETWELGAYRAGGVEAPA